MSFKYIRYVTQVNKHNLKVDSAHNLGSIHFMKNIKIKKWNCGTNKLLLHSLYNISYHFQNRDITVVIHKNNMEFYLFVYLYLSTLSSSRIKTSCQNHHHHKSIWQRAISCHTCVAWWQDQKWSGRYPQTGFFYLYISICC